LRPKKTKVDKLTIKTLAKELKVSISTVSRALADSHEISEVTKQKVLALACALNYTPNPYASSLRRKKSKTIGVILPEVADNFFSLAIKGIQSIAEVKGYHLLIYLSHEKFSNEKAIIDECRSGRVDGVLISISSETMTSEHFLKLQSENIPIVFFDREFENVNAAKVITNDYECGYNAAKHLMEQGCVHPVFLSVSNSLSICKKRADGFKAALKENEITARDDKAIVVCSNDNEETYQQIFKLIKGKNRPDGIVASVERLAMQVYLACRQCGIRIPEELKVIAFSTVETAPILNPSLTTVQQPAFEIGKAAAQILFKSIEKSHVDYSRELVVLPSVLIKRDSTRLIKDSVRKDLKNKVSIKIKNKKM
jgi:LacI family transcriptional regulator